MAQTENHSSLSKPALPYQALTSTETQQSLTQVLQCAVEAQSNTPAFN